jgi:hypothetical protein
MDSIQTLSNAVKAALSGNTLYQNYFDTWKYYLESYTGGEEYRSAGHLVRYQLENEREYNARLEQTPLDNHCNSVISVYNSFLFREQPVREFGQIEGSREVKEFLKDADYDGRSLTAFMKDVATWASVFGHCYVMVTKANIGATTRAEEQAQGVRPYVSYLTPLVVLDWEYTRSPVGRYELTYFKYLEDVNGQINTVKEWRQDSITTTVVDTENNHVIEITEEPNQLGKIPAVCVYNQKGIARGIGVSDIADISDLQKFIYNGTSEIMQSIQMDTHPSLVATTECNVGTGSGALIHMPENMDPGLKPYLLEFTGAGVDKILSAIKQKEDAINNIANTGAVRATESRTMSGVAMEVEFQLLNAKLAEKADNLELAEEQIWRLFSEYLGVAWQGSIDYPGSFNIRDTGSEIQQLQNAKLAATNPIVLEEIDAKILAWMGVDDYEMVDHDTTTPDNRSEHIQQMIMDGYTDDAILEMHSEITAADIASAKASLLDLPQGE